MGSDGMGRRHPGGARREGDAAVGRRRHGSDSGGSAPPDPQGRRSRQTMRWGAGTTIGLGAGTTVACGGRGTRQRGVSVTAAAVVPALSPVHEGGREGQ